MDRALTSGADFGILLFLGCVSGVFAVFAFSLYILMSPTVLKESGVISYRPPEPAVILSATAARQRMEMERAAEAKAKEMNAEAKLDIVPANRIEAPRKPKRLAARTRVAARAPNSAGLEAWGYASQPSGSQASGGWAQRPFAFSW
jgi:hypothetical protein